MCGIIGYLGRKQAIPILIEGLKRLEYRGYDSAGIACFAKNRFEVCKSIGKIKNLEKKLKNFSVKSEIGIGHTRWATHGTVSISNTHPHFDCKKEIALVHNGIIENYQELKRILIKEGHHFYSDTDTEVIAHLIEKYYQKNLQQAVRKALLDLEGTYGLVVFSSREPNKLIAARHGSPLILGVAKDGFLLASDINPLLPHTKKVIYLKDNELVEIVGRKYKISNLSNKKIKRQVKKVFSKTELSEKQGFPHFMLKEIFEQPKVVRNAFAGRIKVKRGKAQLGGLNLSQKELKKVKRVLFIACGTAYYAGLVGKYIIEELVSLPCDVEYASEFRYKNFILSPDTLVFVISQSGETADTIAAMREIQKRGNKVLGISNVVGSTIARETDGGSFIYAGLEIGVASTKAFIGQLTVLTILALELARFKGVSVKKRKEIIQALLKIPQQIEEILKSANKIKKLAIKYSKYKNFLYLGRKFNYPIALEGALKLKEISYIHAEAYSAGEMKHGPIALIDRRFPTFVIVPQDSVYEKTINNIEEIKARKGKIVALTTRGARKISKIVDDSIFIPKTIEVLQPFLTVVPCQLFAYYLAVKRGLDVDKPRNLAKSVTVE